MSFSCDHCQLGACKLFLEKPVAHIDREVDLLTLDDLNLSLVFLHVHSDEFVANFWCVLCTVNVTEWLLLKLFELLWFQLVVVLLTLPPADLVQALTEEDDESEHCLVELVIDLLGDVVEVEGEDLVDLHAQLLVLCQVVVVSLPELFLPVLVVFGRFVLF